MSSKRRQRRKACTGKKRHKNREEAEYHRWLLYQQGSTGSLNVYHCKFCNGWHVGHREGSSKFKF